MLTMLLASVGGVLGIEKIDSPGIPFIEVAILLNLPGAVVTGVSIPGFFMGAGEDAAEGVFLLFSVPIGTLFWGLVGYFAGRLYERFRDRTPIVPLEKNRD